MIAQDGGRRRRPESWVRVKFECRAGFSRRHTVIGSSKRASKYLERHGAGFCRFSCLSTAEAERRQADYIACIWGSGQLPLSYCGAALLRASPRSGIGLKNTLVPDSTRSFFGYLLGAKDHKTFSWDELCAAADKPLINPPLNTEATLASSADDFVSYYSRALQGEFFHNQQTLGVFREVLSIGDAIWLVPVPLGVSAFVKGGSIDVAGFHALCVPGGMLFDDRWVYFCLTLNWKAPGETDPATVQAFAAACSAALTRVKAALGCQG